MAFENFKEYCDLINKVKVIAGAAAKRHPIISCFEVGSDTMTNDIIIRIHLYGGKSIVRSIPSRLYENPRFDVVRHVTYMIDDVVRIEQHRRENEDGYEPIPPKTNKAIADSLVRRIIFNGPATIVFWRDGTKTVVKCQNGEPFDPEKGLAMAIVKKGLYGGLSVFNKLLDKAEHSTEEPRGSDEAVN